MRRKADYNGNGLFVYASAVIRVNKPLLGYGKKTGTKIEQYLSVYAMWGVVI